MIAAVPDLDGDGPVAVDPSSRDVLDRLARVARSTIRVLLTGPRGVGKTLLAERLHVLSGRRGAFVVVDCPAIQPTLFERELFGHERAAFTGADRAVPGLVAAAEGGTLFLEEVGDLAPENQARLLSFLGSGGYRPVGAVAQRQASVRVVAASHRDLGSVLSPELLDRLREAEVRVPPLDERPGDLLPLAEALVARWAAREGWRPRPISAEARELLLARTWPGNVRALSSAVHLALNDAELEGASVLLARHFGGRGVPRAGTWDDRVRAFEREMLTDVLRATHGNVTQAARRLGVERGTIHRHVRRLGIVVGR